MLGETSGASSLFSKLNRESIKIRKYYTDKYLRFSGKAYMKVYLCVTKESKMELSFWFYTSLTTFMMV
jgi:hypothetical protein